MTDGDLDRYLSADAGVVPSSGFAANVMDAVRREAATPPPIPFPWKRAFPGLLAAALIVICFAVVLRAVPATGEISWSWWPRVQGYIAMARAHDAGWIALALLVSFLSVKLARRLAAV